MSDHVPSTGVGLRSDRENHDAATGRFTKGNTASVIIGHKSQRFWLAAAELVDREAHRLIQDAGYRAKDEPCRCGRSSCVCPPVVPEPLVLAAYAMSRAAICEGGLWTRMLEVGGPISATGRQRGIFTQWATAGTAFSRAFADYRQARVLPRQPVAVVSLDDALNAVQESAVQEDRNGE